MAAFVVAGVALFWMYGAAAVDERPAIVLSESFISQLIAERELVMERKLTESEIELIRQNFIDQEVLVREAMTRQLYLNDGRVRHRLADKMFYILSDAVSEPSEAELAAFFAAHRDHYRTPELITFSHRFYGDDEARARAALSGSGVILDEGIAFYMGDAIERYARPELIPIFGREFTESLAGLPVGMWQEPLRSGRGWHLVRVEARIPSRDLTRDEIDGRLQLDWRDAQLAASRRAQLDALRSNYQIVTTAATADD